MPPAAPPRLRAARTAQATSRPRPLRTFDGRVRGANPLPLAAGIGPGDSPWGGEPFTWAGGSRSRSAGLFTSWEGFITPEPSFVKLHQFQVEVERHPRDQVVHPDRVERVLGVQQCLLCVEHLEGQGGGPAGVGLGPRGGRGEQDGLRVVYLRIPQLYETLLKAVQLRYGPQLPDVGPDVVGDVVLEGHQVPP